MLRKKNIYFHYFFMTSIALGYGLDDRGSRVRFPVGLGIFLFTTACRRALGPTKPPIQWVQGALSLEVKRPEREAHHSPSSTAEVKNAWSCTSTPPIHMAWCLVKHRDNLTFTFTFTFCLLPAQFCCKSVHERNFEHHMQILGP
jgi:hypothetical protein